MPKNIVLFSDGTGNKGGYGDDTNVYKLYRSIDIHNTEHPQITFYDNGVGTNIDGEALKQNKFWRGISGAFGFGFENNVRDLYEFLAVNYEVGDQIYVFGFSRGASTVRAFTGFLHTCGLLNKNDQQGNRKNRKEFQYQIDQAIQAYQQWQKDKSIADKFKQNHAIKDDTYAPDGNIKIKLIGVWDTVSALGFPKDWSLLFDWFFSMMDKLTEEKWPHNYYNFDLNADIEYAYQALSIDDERQTFSPKVWKEKEPKKRKKDSVEQVWFAGVHSNVGGGYPRNGLSDVAMAWMMTRAKKQGLIYVQDTMENAVDYANVQGKLYNSRDGFGVYYRYQPRDIQRTVDERLLGNVKIHNTVMERLKKGTAGYAPTYLPEEFDVVDTEGKLSEHVKCNPEQWKECRDETHSLVDKQRTLYRIFVESTVVLLAFVLMFWASPPDSVLPYLENGGTDNVFFLFAWIHTLLTYILPAIFKNFLTYILCVHGWIFVFMVATLYGMLKIRKSFNIDLNKVLATARLLVLNHLKASKPEKKGSSTSS